MYHFDVSLEAKATLKERLVWMLYLGIMFFLLYGSANQIAAVTSPHSSIVFDWEKYIPFIEASIIPYMASDLMFTIAFLLAYTRLELRVLALRIFFIVNFSVLCFLLFPLQFSFEKPQIETFTFLYTLLEADLPYNQAPSLHVSFAIVVYFSMAEKIENFWIKLILALWFTTIAFSTLVVYQHHFIDLPTGVLVGFLTVYFINKKRDLKILKAFMTPRSLKMALYYIVGAVIFVVLSFQVSFLLFYIAFSLFFVSVIYAFGLNHLLEKRSLYPLLLPYFLGNQLSWLYYKRNLSLMTKVDKNVYFGRKPSFQETGTFVNNIKVVIDLAPEHFYRWQGVYTKKNFVFLDQTIPSPELLHEVVVLIEKYKSEGVYVHCALGLSRSVLVISAWLLYRGYSRDEVEEKMKKIRPNYVKSAYMGIALDIYERYLKEKEHHNVGV